jgi:hypothetical protein
MIRAYSCRPVGEDWHLVVFAASARRAKLLGFRNDPGDCEWTEWRVRRLPEADGLYASEAVWVQPSDAPEWLQAAAAGLWREAVA